MLTANDARKMMPSKVVETAISEIEEVIKKAAKNNQKQCRIPLKWVNTDGGMGSVDMNQEPLASIVKHFRKHFFDVNDFYYCGNYVESGVLISWDE